MPESRISVSRSSRLQTCLQGQYFFMVSLFFQFSLIVLDKDGYRSLFDADDLITLIFTHLLCPYLNSLVVTDWDAMKQHRPPFSLPLPLSLWLLHPIHPVPWPHAGLQWAIRRKSSEWPQASGLLLPQTCHISHFSSVLLYWEDLQPSSLWTPIQFLPSNSTP